MKTKVLVISDYRDTNSVRPEAELFIGLQQAGLEITVMTFDQAAYIQRFEAAGIRVIGFHPERKLDFVAIRIIRQELRTGGHHILHLFNSRAILNGIQAASGLPVKVVLYRGYTGHIHCRSLTSLARGAATATATCVGKFHFTDAYFSTAYGARHVPQTHIVTLGAMVAHRRLPRRVR